MWCDCTGKQKCRHCRQGLRVKGAEWASPFASSHVYGNANNIKKYGISNARLVEVLLCENVLVRRTADGALTFIGAAWQ